MQLTLEGKTKDQVAIERIQAFEPPGGYYLAFSGGKDSVTLLALAKKAGVKFDAHYHLTTVDPPEVVQFIKGMPEVEIARPARTMWQLIEAERILPTRQIRYCCRHLKENGGQGRLVLTGIRWAESSRRANRKMLEYSKREPSKRFMHAIIDWTDDDIWQFIHENGVPYCRLYDEGWKRLGCVLCPMSRGEQLQRQITQYPKIAQAWLSATRRMWEHRPPDKDFATADDYFNWWLSREGLKDSQQATFDDCLVPFSD